MLANGCQLYNKEWVKFISGNLHAVWNEFVEPSYSKQSRILVIKRWERYPRYHHFRWVKRISGLCTCQRNGQTWSCHETIDTAIDTHWWQSRIVGFLIWITKSMISSPFLDDRILKPGDLPSPIPPLGSNLWGPMKLGATEHVAGYVPGRMEKSAMLVMGCCHKYVKGKATEQVICGVTSVSHEKKVCWLRVWEPAFFIKLKTHMPSMHLWRVKKPPCDAFWVSERVVRHVSIWIRVSQNIAVHPRLIFGKPLFGRLMAIEEMNARIKNHIISIVSMHIQYPAISCPRQPMESRKNFLKVSRAGRRSPRAHRC